ncbi:MAG: SIS domain-containing protein [bacterium]|nr:SIS domain-containing protein [bacterium]
MSGEKLSREFMTAQAADKLRHAVSEAAAMQNQLVVSCAAQLAAIARASAACLMQGGKLLFCGNGGSAAESQHLATEFVVRLSAHRERKALAAMALTTDTSLLTACSNDYGFDRVFARQIEALLRPGDILFMLSTSGRSQNLLLAADTAGKLGGTRVALLGQDQTPLDQLTDFAVHIPSTNGQRVQEAHLLCGHLVVELIEDSLLASADETTRHIR